MQRDIVIAMVDPGGLAALDGPRMLAISDGRTYRAYVEGRHLMGFPDILRIARSLHVELPVFIPPDHEEHLSLVRRLAAWMGETPRLWHSMPDLARGRSHGGTWWCKTSPVLFACPACNAPFPTFGRYASGYYHCDACRHRDFDVSSVGV